MPHHIAPRFANRPNQNLIIVGERPSLRAFHDAITPTNPKQIIALKK
jgi:hypothetical protein